MSGYVAPKEHNYKQLRDRDAQSCFTGLFLPPSDAGGASERVTAEIVELGLELNAWELDNLGYTVLTPDKANAGDLAAKLREKLLDFAEDEIGFRPNLDTDQRMEAGATPIGRGHMMPGVLFRDPLFEQALMTRGMLALITYLLGESCILSSSSAMLKVRAPEQLELHSDQVGQPSPLPAYAQVANATWALSDYSSENGAIRFVPGSHKLCRHPTPAEAVDTSATVTVSAPAGSIIIWHGNTWHGAAPRTNAGARLSLVFLFNRWYILPQIMHRLLASEDMLKRNPDRFATLMGLCSPYSGQHANEKPVDFTLGQAGQHA